MTVIRWEEPPPRRTRDVYAWDAIADALMARPKEWALVVVCPNTATAGSTARHIRNGMYEPLRAGFDAVARTVDGEARVYARYVGAIEDAAKWADEHKRDHAEVRGA